MSLPRVVVIAYGNPLRTDDGLAWRAADELQKKFSSPEIEILQVHQLAPELAESISRAHAVIFVDAAAPQPGKTHPGEIRIVEIGEHEINRAPNSALHHQFSAISLLAIARQLYRSCPRAFVATLTGEDFNIGESLSPKIQYALPEFVQRIEKFIRSLIKAR
jgi:hydrogenase maturation protease